MSLRKGSSLFYKHHINHENNDCGPDRCEEHVEICYDTVPTSIPPDFTGP
jgi:hypothetical protein